MYTVVTDNKREEFKTKEELISYFVSRENLFGVVPETYVQLPREVPALVLRRGKGVEDCHGVRRRQQGR